MEPMTGLGEATTLPAHAKRIGRPSWTERHFGWLLAAPGALVILALSLYPLIYSVWVAFVNYDFLVPGHAFVGWGNFSQVLADPVALQAVIVTLVLAGLNVFVEFVLGLALALAMSSSFRGRSVLMSLFIVPLFVSPVIVGQF
jgi:multiple sugar transport system permease protein